MTDWIGDGVKDQPSVGGSFKEQIAADLDIFLNPDEFGEYAIVDGVSMCVVLSNDKRDTNTIDGIISYDAVIMHAREDDLRRLAKGLPVVNRTLMINGRSYIVTSVKCDMGMASVEMQRAEM